MFCNQHVDFMSLCESTDELDIFETDCLKELIDFKWVTYSQKWHILGCIMHFLYMFTIVLFVQHVYIEMDLEEKHYYDTILAAGILYPLTYDTMQLWRVGVKEYFSEFWNYTDFAFIWLGVANVIMQSFDEPFALYNKLVFILVILMAIIKTFFFLRIFGSLSYIVTMLTHVIYDLRIFLLFYFMLIFMFSLIFGVLGIGQEEIANADRRLRVGGGASGGC